MQSEKITRFFASSSLIPLIVANGYAKSNLLIQTTETEIEYDIITNYIMNSIMSLLMSYEREILIVRSKYITSTVIL